MMTPSLRDDRRLDHQRIQTLSSVDGLAEFFAYLRYPEDGRLEMTPDALQLPKSLKDVTRHIERLTSVEGGALEVYLFELTSVTVAHTRALARAFRNRAGNFLLVLTDDYERIDFVLLEREVPGLSDGSPSRRGVTVRPRVLSVDRRDPSRVSLRVLRRFTFTEYDADGARDPYAQWDKLKSAYTVAEWSEPLFNNRALFSDYYLNQRLPALSVWKAEDRNRAFREVRGTFAHARSRFAGEDSATIRGELIRPLLEILGFDVEELVELNVDLMARPGAQEAYLSALRSIATIFGTRKAVVRSIVDNLDEIAAQTLVVWGEQDAILPVAHAHAAGEAIPDARLRIFQRCGHAVPMEKAEAFNALVSEFLNGQSTKEEESNE